MILDTNKTKVVLPPDNIMLSYPRDNSYIIVTWNETHADGYNVYKGTGPHGIFYLMNDTPLSTNRFEDREVSRNPNIQNWYKVSAVYKAEDGYRESELSDAVCYQVHNTDKWFNKINERNFWILQNMGVLCDLYTRKYDGERCPDCYDPVRGRAGNSTCTTCFGTGYVGGYNPQYQLYVRFRPQQTALEIGSQMFTLNNQPIAWTISDTKIANRDIIINPEGKIFQVLNSTVSHAAGYLFHQEFTLKEFEPEDPIYKMKRKTLYPFNPRRS